MQQLVGVAGDAQGELGRGGELSPFVALGRGLEAIKARLLLEAALLNLLYS